MAENSDQEIKGLPEGARIQTVRGKRYVFFSYSFSSNGKRKQERDYIGTVSDDNVFQPNYYYTSMHPVRSRRSADRWRDETKRAKVQRQLDEEKRVREQAAKTEREERNKYGDFALPAEGARCVGLTALVIAMLYQSQMVRDVCVSIFGGKVDATVKLINLVVHLVISSDPTYLASNESRLQCFIGGGCLTSPRASEFFAAVGANLSCSEKICKARAKRLAEGSILVLDGTRINCDSEHIVVSAIGKDKQETYCSQINFSMLANASDGQLVGYRYYAGNINDVSTLSDMRAIWNDSNLNTKKATIVMDRGYISTPDLIELSRDGYKFLLGGKTSMNVIKDVIANENAEFYRPSNAIPHRDCYGRKDSWKASSHTGKPCTFYNYIYRDPVLTIKGIDELNEKLLQVEQRWLDGQTTASDRNEYFRFFKRPRTGCPLTRDPVQIDAEGYIQGFFAFIGNVNRPLPDVLDTYRKRNEIEVMFRLMFGMLIKSTRVHSTAALDTLMLIVFVALSVVTTLRNRMMKVDTPEEVAKPRGDKPSKLGKHFSIAETFGHLQSIMMSKDSNGELRLYNVTSKQKALVAAIGLPGLYDSPQTIAKLLSPTYMAEVMQAPEQEWEVP